MTQKERAILVLKAMIKADEIGTKQTFLDKLNACMALQRPNKVLLTEKSEPIYNELVKEEKKKGKIA